MSPPPLARPARVSAAAVALAVGAGALAACAPPVGVQAAPDAANPDCARVMIAAPDPLGGLPLRETTSQATAAWGEEFVIVARCGVPVPGPTTDPCVTVEAGGYTADWVLADEGGLWRATTYGRDPAVEAVIPKARADEAVADLLAELTPSAALAPTTGRACLGLDG